MASEISSEIYEEYKYKTDAAPTLHNCYVVSRFVFNYPPTKPRIDEEGDFIVERKNNITNGAVEIEHSSSTCLDLVGLQVWRGALLLADWVMYTAETLKNTVILELGSGTGLTSIIGSMFAPVICTDLDKGNILKLITNNVNRNKHLSKFSVEVAEIDFTQTFLPINISNQLNQIKVILAADVVYDDRITEAFVKTLNLILDIKPSCLIYVALEKRYVFTVADCDVVAPCYEHFLEILNKHNLQVENISLNFPKYFQYDRVKELILCKIYRHAK